MTGYNNRLSGGVCTPCTANKPAPATTPVQTEKTISNISCGTQKVISITKIKDKVVIMLDDCSYITAPLSVVDSNFCGELAESSNEVVETLTAKLTALQEKVNTLKLKEDKDTMFDPSEIQSKLSELTERVTAEENKADNDTVFDPTNINEAIAQLLAKVEALEAKEDAREDRDTVYDDSALVQRIEALESKTDNDTIFDPTVINNRLTALENRPTGSGNDPRVDKLYEKLITISSLQGEAFKAFSLDVDTPQNSGTGSMSGSGVAMDTAPPEIMA